MEFVLVTTTSTPTSSRSGSVMKFGDYREDEQKVDEAAALPLEKEFLQFDIDSDDEDLALLEGFNALSARQRLIAHEFCTKLVLDHDQQKSLRLEVGLHISEENPWKQVQKGALLDYIPDDDASPEVTDFRMKLHELSDDSLVLVGFAAAITDDIDDTDTFLFYVDPESAKESVSLIARLEAFERQRVNRTIYKYPRPWQSLGSENEVDLQVEVKQKDRIEVEIQRLCPSNSAPDQLSFRFAEDVRDGYVELVPKRKDINIVMRSSVSVAVQSATQRVESEQQTEPTFPANKWSQYSYELPIDPEEPESTVEDNDATEANESCDDDEEDEDEKVQDIIGPSDAMKELLRALEFSAIDIYRDDYEQIASKAIKPYVRPVITEIFCFIDPKRCANKFVNAFVWHPMLSGVFVASYTHKNLNTFSRDEKLSEAEMSKNSVMHANPVLLWSFVDSLYPKLVLETPREVTFLSFCPYDANLLIGGLITGQLIIWDLKNCLHRVEHPEELSDKQEKNRNKMHSFMTWSKFTDNLQQNVIHPAAVSHYELSHKKLITSIKWLNRKHNVATTGLIQESIKPNEQFRQFVTASLDGNVLFWDLDFVNSDLAPKEIKRTDTKKKLSIRTVPEKCISPYDKLNGVFCPIYAATCEQPISSLIFDEGLFRYEAKGNVENSQIEQRIEFNVIQEQQEKASNRLVVSSLLGSIGTFIWEGFMYKEGKPEKTKQIESFDVIHNGPVLMIERNPFLSSIILSIGQNILAIWSESNQSVPILWRRRETNITCAQWSPTRISLFFIARYDGIIELWDLLTRSDDACISHNAGTTLITVISQHKLSLPTDILMIADQRANLRAFTLPSVSQPKDDDLHNFKQFIDNELKRKEQFNEWQQSFIKKNEDLTEPKQLIREESRRTMLTETLTPQQTDANVKDEKKGSSSVGARSKSIAKQCKSKRVFDLPERLHKKWEDMMVKRLVKRMIALKRFDLEQIAIQIQPEKDRLAYNAEKKRAIEEVFKKMQNEVSEIRARLMPPKDVDQEADRLNLITTNVDSMLSMTMDGFEYDTIKAEMEKKVYISKSDFIEIKWHELLNRAQTMRSARSKAIYEQRRMAYIGKSTQIETKAEE